MDGGGGGGGDAAAALSGAGVVAVEGEVTVRRRGFPNCSISIFGTQLADW